MAEQLARLSLSDRTQPTSGEMSNGGGTALDLPRPTAVLPANDSGRTPARRTSADYSSDTPNFSVDSGRLSSSSSTPRLQDNCNSNGNTDFRSWRCAAPPLSARAALDDSEDDTGCKVLVTRAPPQPSSGQPHFIGDKVGKTDPIELVTEKLARLSVCDSTQLTSDKRSNSGTASDVLLIKRNFEVSNVSLPANYYAGSSSRGISAIHSPDTPNRSVDSSNCLAFSSPLSQAHATKELSGGCQKQKYSDLMYTMYQLRQMHEESNVETERRVPGTCVPLPGAATQPSSSLPQPSHVDESGKRRNTSKSNRQGNNSAVTSEIVLSDNPSQWSVNADLELEAEQPARSSLNDRAQPSSSELPDVGPASDIPCPNVIVLSANDSVTSSRGISAVHSSDTANHSVDGLCRSSSSPVSQGNARSNVSAMSTKRQYPEFMYKMYQIYAESELEARRRIVGSPTPRHLAQRRSHRHPSRRSTVTKFRKPTSNRQAVAQLQIYHVRRSYSLRNYYYYYTLLLLLRLGRFLTYITARHRSRKTRIAAL